MRSHYLYDIPFASKLALAFIPILAHAMFACTGQPTICDTAWWAVATDLIHAEAYAWDSERLLASWPLDF